MWERSRSIFRHNLSTCKRTDVYHWYRLINEITDCILITSIIVIKRINIFCSKITVLLFFQLGTPVHEIGHMLGFWHEHQRHDRNSHVDILYENIQAGAESNFNILSAFTGDTKGLPYDFSSVMHYTGKVGENQSLF